MTEWISVEDRLPNSTVDCAVRQRGFINPKTGWLEERPDVWFLFGEHNCYEARDVTHWMPLTDPPEVDDE